MGHGDDMGHSDDGEGTPHREPARVRCRGGHLRPVQEMSRIVALAFTLLICAFVVVVGVASGTDVVVIVTEFFGGAIGV